MIAKPMMASRMTGQHARRGRPAIGRPQGHRRKPRAVARLEVTPVISAVRRAPRCRPRRGRRRTGGCAPRGAGPRGSRSRPGACTADRGAGTATRGRSGTRWEGGTASQPEPWPPVGASAFVTAHTRVRVSDTSVLSGAPRWTRPVRLRPLVRQFNSNPEAVDASSPHHRRADGDPVHAGPRQPHHVGQRRVHGAVHGQGQHRGGVRPRRQEGRQAQPRQQAGQGHRQGHGRSVRELRLA